MIYNSSSKRAYNEKAKGFVGDVVSSLTIFGDNLRYLCHLNDLAFAQVCRDLDIGKVQFQRFLRGESFPKPNLLIKICTYFDTDARILTTPLPFSAAPQPEQQPHPPMIRALRYATAEMNYMPANCELPDGNYQVWRMSFVYPNKAAQGLYRIYTKDGAKLIRSFEPLEAHPHVITNRSVIASRAPLSREWRGYIHTTPEGHSLFIYGITAPKWINYMFISPHPSAYNDIYTGFITISRKEYVGLHRLSRICWVKLLPNFSDLMRAARMPVWMDIEDTPRVVRDTLTAPLG